MTKPEFNQDPRAVTRARTKAKMAKVDLARAVGCSRSLITEIEGGTRNAREELLAAMAKVLDVPVEQLRRKRPGEPGRQAAQTGDGRLLAVRDEERPDRTDDVQELRRTAVGGQ
jgi:transcriptional regulator with XRE-family HTH domain